MIINMPNYFNIFGLKIGIYGIMMDLAYLTSLIITMYRAKKRNLDRDFILGIFINAIIFGIIGAKLFWVISVGRKFEIFTLTQKMTNIHGFVAYGGIILGILSNFIWCIIKKKDFYTYFDIVMPSVAAAQAIGRIGCLFNGCCFGHPVVHTHWYTVTYTQSPFVYAGMPIIPIQLVSALGDMLLCVILIIYSNKVKTKGYTASMYLILYSVGRFIVEYYRADYRGNVGNLTTSQFIGIFIFIIGVLQFIYCTYRDRLKIAIKTNLKDLKESREKQKRIKNRQREKQLKIQRRRRKKHGK